MFNSQAKQRPCTERLGASLVLSCGVPGVPREREAKQAEVQEGALHALPARAPRDSVQAFGEELRFQRNSQGTPAVFSRTLGTAHSLFMRVLRKQLNSVRVIPQTSRDTCFALCSPTAHAGSPSSAERKRSEGHVVSTSSLTQSSCMQQFKPGKKQDPYLKKNKSSIDKIKKKIKYISMEYSLETFRRSNQDTCLIQKPVVSEGDWVQTGDLLADCASSVGGELSLGQNLLIAYMPWEGYNFEDAILISERLVIDDLYTSVHIERYEIENFTSKNSKEKKGKEEITCNIPDTKPEDIQHLDSYGIVKIGSWVEEGNILVGKVTPINKKNISPMHKSLSKTLGKKIHTFRDSSLRAPKGIKAKVIDIKYFLRQDKNRLESSAASSQKDIKTREAALLSSGVRALPCVTVVAPSLSSSPSAKRDPATQDTGVTFSSLAPKAKQRVAREMKAHASPDLSRDSAILSSPKAKKKRDSVQAEGEAKQVQEPASEAQSTRASLRYLKKFNQNYRVANSQEGLCLLPTQESFSAKQSASPDLSAKICLSSALGQLSSDNSKAALKKVSERNFLAKTTLYKQILLLKNFKRKFPVVSRVAFSDFLSVAERNTCVTEGDTRHTCFFQQHKRDESDTSAEILGAERCACSAGTSEDNLLGASSPLSAGYILNATATTHLFDQRSKRACNASLRGLLPRYALSKRISSGQFGRGYLYSLASGSLAEAGTPFPNPITYVGKRVSNSVRDVISYVSAPFAGGSSQGFSRAQALGASHLSLFLFAEGEGFTGKSSGTGLVPMSNTCARVAKQSSKSLLTQVFAERLGGASPKANRDSVQPPASHLSVLLKATLAPSLVHRVSRCKARVRVPALKKLASLTLEMRDKALLFSFSRSFSSSLARGTQARMQGKGHISRSFLKNLETLHIYLAEKRQIQVGDKMAGRHGNKGIVSHILPIQDMPYLPDGTSIDMVLNPLGVPSRMNVGQIYECLLGLAGKYLGEHFKVFSFDEVYGPEASRSLVFSKLYQARTQTGLNFLFNPNFPGKICIYDGRTGECFDQPITVGQAYMLRLVHMVDDKIHMRSVGPYSLVTQQPLRGRSKQGGQRLGEMEVWALEGYGAAFTLLEMLTIKSDDLSGRQSLWSNLIFNRDISIGTPESFKVLICELQALCMDIGLFRSTKFQRLDMHAAVSRAPSLSAQGEGKAYGVAEANPSQMSRVAFGEEGANTEGLASLTPRVQKNNVENVLKTFQDLTEITSLINFP